MLPPPPRSTLFPYTTLFRSVPFSSGEASEEELLLVAAGKMRMPQSALNVDELRSEEHTSELQSRFDLVCRLLLEKKKSTIAAARVVGDVEVRGVEACWAFAA